VLVAVLAISNGATVHESRQLPSWLIFDVRHKMTNLTRMFSPAQVAVASLIGSPLPAFYLLAQNYRVAQQPKNARFMLAVGVIVTALLIAMAFLLPGNGPRSPLTIIIAVCVHQIAKMAQGALLAHHVAAGGKMSSWWVAVGLGCLGMLAVLAVVFGLSFVLPDE
jgi:hypothetical protein